VSLVDQANKQKQDMKVIQVISECLS